MIGRPGLPMSCSSESSRVPSSGRPALSRRLPCTATAPAGAPHLASLRGRSQLRASRPQSPPARRPLLPSSARECAVWPCPGLLQDCSFVRLRPPCPPILPQDSPQAEAILSSFKEQQRIFTPLSLSFLSFLRTALRPRSILGIST